MRIAFTFLCASLLAASGAWAQSAPGGPLFPSAGWAAQQAGLGPVGSRPAILGQGQFFLSTLTSSAIGGRTETMLRYGASEKLSLGLTHFQRQGTLRPSVNYSLTPESIESPSINVGYFDVSGGSKGSAYYATAGRTISDMGPVLFSGYVGAAKVVGERTPRFLIGAAFPLLKDRATASAQWEGKKLSLGLVGAVGSVSHYPIRLGLILTGDTLGTMAASTWRR